MDAHSKQRHVDEANAAFWNTLCGTTLAKRLGVTDDKMESLERFDAWYFDYYPYLLTHVPVFSFKNKKVLEVGLGYGTLSQAIAEHRADYTGMDIAGGPVSMVNHRLWQRFLKGQAIQGSFLENEFGDDNFDAVVAIGCFHHTGNVQRCFDETWRILKPGGSAYLMVYNRYSHRRWMKSRKAFLREAALETLGLLRLGVATEAERRDSDSVDGEAAPETVFLSTREIKRRMAQFRSVYVTKENMDQSQDPRWARERLLETWGRRMGLDLYITAVK